MAGTVADCDAVAAVLAYLAAHPVAADLGGLSARNEPPYPRVRLLDVPGGDLGTGQWRVALPVQVETWADPDGRPGKAALRGLHYRVMVALRGLAEQTFPPGEAVVTDVAYNGAGGYAPEGGQHKYVSQVTLTMHPPR